MTTIMIVDDETTVREVVRSYLELEQFTVIEASTGVQALNLLREHPPDLLILDVMLPEIDGFSITQLLRSSDKVNHLGYDSNIPLILLTARTEESDRITGFELGADDYVTKPFSPRELVMRVKAVLRRQARTADESPPPDDNALVFPGLRIMEDERRVEVDGQAVALTPKEFDLLVCMARHPGKVFSRPQLLDQVWGYESSDDDRIVTVHVSRLREKLENPAHPVACIHTVWGIGYKFEL
ncbi:MAG: response regulator transcription factor [Chloroflexota bacterium]